MSRITLKIVKVLDRKGFDPAVWRLFNQIKKSGRSLDDVGEEAGVSPKALVSWRNKRRSPTLINFRAVANALGYEVVLVPIGTVDRYYGPAEKSEIKKQKQS